MNALHRCAAVVQESLREMAKALPRRDELQVCTHHLGNTLELESWGYAACEVSRFAGVDHSEWCRYCE